MNTSSLEFHMRSRPGLRCLRQDVAGRSTSAQQIHVSESICSLPKPYPSRLVFPVIMGTCIREYMLSPKTLPQPTVFPVIMGTNPANVTGYHIVNYVQLLCKKCPSESYLCSAPTAFAMSPTPGRATTRLAHIGSYRHNV